jgi:hypothetical protein
MNKQQLMKLVEQIAPNMKPNNQNNNKPKPRDAGYQKKPVVVKPRKQNEKTYSPASALFPDQNKASSMMATTAQFCSVYTDPFLQTEASLPVLPLLAHQCVISKTGGVGITNSSGVGSVIIYTINMITNDQVAAAYSTINTAASTFLYAGATGSSYSLSNSPYASSAFDLTAINLLQARLVAVGLRVKYTGSVFMLLVIFILLN